MRFLSELLRRIKAGFDTVPDYVKICQSIADDAKL